jgi:hypothetical protein
VQAAQGKVSTLRQFPLKDRVRQSRAMLVSARPSRLHQVRIATAHLHTELQANNYFVFRSAFCTKFLQKRCPVRRTSDCSGSHFLNYHQFSSVYVKQLCSVIDGCRDCDGVTTSRRVRERSRSRSSPRGKGDPSSRGAIHQLLNIIIQLRILVLLLVSTLPYVVKVKNYS